MLLFIRDNVFRALAQLDTDFTRHIEGHTLRLHWDEGALFHFVAQRLRVAFNIEAVESDVKVWDRFAHRDLKERDGFLACLHHTLYRPRDILVLLNDAYSSATREGREGIVGEDIQTSAVRISQHRLQDLLKEYETVFPGLTLFVSLFRGRAAEETFGGITDMLETAVGAADYGKPAARDFGLFSSGPEIFSALYSVGFLGVRDSSGPAYTFCHDGAQAALANLEPLRPVAVHPCYWKALELRGEMPPEEVVVRINDEYEAKTSVEMKDMRQALLGEIQGKLPGVPLGPDGSRDFEQWVVRAVRMLFSGKLSNIQLKPNPGAVQQRDVVGTNMAERGFWKRILDDYKTRQVIFEVKNYAEVQPDDFRQVLSYSSGEYGRFLIVVSRGESEVVTPREKDWTREIWVGHQRIVMVLPAMLLARCISKLRNPKKYDYSEDLLGKRMDLVVRSYLNLPITRRFRRRGRKRK